MERLADDVDIEDPQEEHDDDRNDQHVEASGLQQLGFAAANLMDQLDAASSSSSTGVQTPGQSSSSSSSMNLSSSSSLGNNSSVGHHPFESGIEVTMSVFKKKQEDELRQKLAEETMKHEERERRRLMAIEAQKSLVDRVKQAKEAGIGASPLAQTDIFIVKNIRNSAEIKRACDQNQTFQDNDRIVRFKTHFHKDIQKKFNDGDQDVYFKGVDIFDDGCGLTDEQRWATIKDFASQTKIALVAGKLTWKQRFVALQVNLGTLSNRDLMETWMSSYRQLTDDASHEGLTEKEDIALTAFLIKLDDKGLFRCNPKADKGEWLQLLTRLLEEYPSGKPLTLKSLGAFARDVGREIVSKQSFSGVIDESLRADAGKPAAKPKANAMTTSEDAGGMQWAAAAETISVSRCFICNIPGHRAAGCKLREGGPYSHPDAQVQASGPFELTDVGAKYLLAGRNSLARGWALDMSEENMAKIYWTRKDQGDFHSGGATRGGFRGGRGGGRSGGRGRFVHFDNAQGQNPATAVVHNNGGRGDGDAGRGFGRGRGRGNGGSDRRGRQDDNHPYQPSRQTFRGRGGDTHFLLATEIDTTNDKIIHGYVSLLDDVIHIRTLIDQGALSDNYVDSKLAMELVSRGLAKKKKLCRCINGHCKETVV